MKRTVLFGAGQIGAMCRRLLGPNFQLLCFADNNAEKWGKTFFGLDICSPAYAIAQNPDCVVCCVLDQERFSQMKAQLADLHFQGELLSPEALRSFDVRYATMRLLAEQIKDMAIPGAAAELGVFQGDFAAAINDALPDRELHLFDTFSGFTAADVDLECRQGFSRAKAGDFSDTCTQLVLQRLPHKENAVFHVGYFPDSFSSCEASAFALVSLDADLYAPTAAALPLFYDRLSPGGVIIIHDVNSTQFTGVSQAVQEFCQSRGLLPIPMCDLHGSVILRKPLQV